MLATSSVFRPRLHDVLRLVAAFSLLVSTAQAFEVDASEWWTPAANFAKVYDLSGEEDCETKSPASPAKAAEAIPFEALPLGGFPLSLLGLGTQRTRENGTNHKAAVHNAGEVKAAAAPTASPAKVAAAPTASPAKATVNSSLAAKVKLASAASVQAPSAVPTAAAPSAVQAQATVAAPAVVQAHATAAAPSVVQAHATAAAPSVIQAKATAAAPAAVQAKATAAPPAAVQVHATAAAPAAVQALATAAAPAAVQALATAAAPSAVQAKATAARMSAVQVHDTAAAPVAVQAHAMAAAPAAVQVQIVAVKLNATQTSAAKAAANNTKVEAKAAVAAENKKQIPIPQIPKKTWAEWFRMTMSFAFVIKALCMGSNLVFQASPLPVIKEFAVKGHTGETDSAPFISIAYGSCQWCFYGLFAFFVTSKQGFLVLVYSNVCGTFLGFFYVYEFVTRCTNADVWLRSKVYFQVLGVVAFSQVVAMCAMPPVKALFFCGIISSAWSVVGATSMLTTVPQVLKTKSSKSLPLPLLLAAGISAVLWIMCGVMLRDPWITVPNVCCFCCTGFALSLCWIYPRTGGEECQEEDEEEAAPLLHEEDEPSDGRQVLSDRQSPLVSLMRSLRGNGDGTPTREASGHGISAGTGETWD